MDPKITSRDIVAENGFATRRTYQRTLSFRCVLCRKKGGYKIYGKEARAQQSGLHCGV